jgi:hypothetical protein
METVFWLVLLAGVALWLFVPRKAQANQSQDQKDTAPLVQFFSASMRCLRHPLQTPHLFRKSNGNP